MRNTTTVIVGLLLLAGVLFPAPTVTAGSGLYRIQNAEINKGNLAFNLHLSGNPAGAYHMNDGDFSTWDGVFRLGASWAPLEYLEVGLVPALGYYKPTSDDTADIGLWDMEINAKTGYSRMQVIKFGLQAKVLLPLASDTYFPQGYTNGLEIGGRGLVTADFRDIIKFPLLLHLNAGYMLSMDSDDTTYRYRVAGYYGDNRMNLGVGLEIPTRFITVLAELYGENPGDMYFTPTLRLNLPFGFHVDYGMDFLVTKADDDPREDFFRTVTTGISWSTPEKKREPMGSIAGIVKDAETGSPLSSKLSYSGTEQGSVNTSAAGFRIDSLTPAVYNLEVNLDGYEQAKKTVTVIDRQTAEVEFLLKPLMLALSGTIRDRQTKTVIPATIRFVDSALPEVKTDANGLYKALLKPGTYKIEVFAEGYLPQTSTVTFAKKDVEKDFDLIKTGMKIAFQGVNFETAKAIILTESYPILDEAAKILLDNPTINVEIGGHTDSRGSDSYNLKLSQDRAEAVKTYLVEKHGIDAARLTAKGYGETKPLAANDTEENMYKNRRVEFTILGK